MRLPSDPRLHVSRRLLLRAVACALLAALVLVPASGAAVRGEKGLFVSKGVGRQVFTGGGGVAYGTLFSGASLTVADYSPGHDMRVDSPVLPTVNADGSRTYVPAGGTPRVVFRISGTLYRVTVTGSSTLNAANVFGRLQLRGKGTLSVNGVRARWNGPAIVLARPAKDIKKAYAYALTGGPPPVVPPVTTTTPTTTTSTGKATAG